MDLKPFTSNFFIFFKLKEFWENIIFFLRRESERAKREGG